MCITPNIHYTRHPPLSVQNRTFITPDIHHILFKLDIQQTRHHADCVWIWCGRCSIEQDWFHTHQNNRSVQKENKDRHTVSVLFKQQSSHCVCIVQTKVAILQTNCTVVQLHCSNQNRYPLDKLYSCTAVSASYKICFFHNKEFCMWQHTLVCHLWD